jgi:uncharacterized repeat protein (TIGR03803 family)
MKLITVVMTAGLVLAACSSGSIAPSPATVGAQTQTEPVKNSSGYSVLYDFTLNAPDYPNGGVTLNKKGDLFGQTYSGGTNKEGDVFELTPSSSGYTFTDIHDFAGTDGEYPGNGAPRLDKKGDVFQTATQGGASSAGTVIELSPSGSSYKETALFSFDTTDGSSPNASLLPQGSTYYTTTVGGGAAGYGALVALSASGLKENVSYSFKGLPNDGQSPTSNFVADSKGRLFGTTELGGSGFGTNGSGIVFEFVPKGDGGTETVLWNFGVATNDGQEPVAPPIIDKAGTLYGTAQYGGDNTRGTVWKLSPNGSGGYTESVLHSFGAGSSDGVYPLGGLVLVGNNLYGTTSGGGSGGQGTIFRISTTGKAYAILHSLTGNDGKVPDFPIWARKGKALYGTTQTGGANGNGTVFRYVI